MLNKQEKHHTKKSKARVKSPTEAAKPLGVTPELYPRRSMLKPREIENMRRSNIMGGLPSDLTAKLIESHLEALDLIEEQQALITELENS